MNSINKVILIIPAFLALTFISTMPNTFAHHSENPDPGQNNIQSFQQSCFTDRCAAGYTSGENQAYSDWSSQNNNPSCPRGHSNEYCSQYWLGYHDEWSRSVSINDNTDQSQGTSVNIKGNGNHVQINQGQQSTDRGFSGSNSHSSSHGQNPKCVLLCVGIN
jgi:hypothetical protein